MANEKTYTEAEVKEMFAEVLKRMNNLKDGCYEAYLRDLKKAPRLAESMADATAGVVMAIDKVRGYMVEKF